MTLKLYIQFWKDILAYWWPLIIVFIIGLIILGFTEKKQELTKLEEFIINNIIFRR